MRAYVLMAVLAGCAQPPASSEVKVVAQPTAAAPIQPAPRIEPREPRASCAGRGTSIYVKTALHRLLLCEADREVATYPIAIGSAGTPKTAEGDRRTPVGQYPLLQPRRSPKWGTFIEIGYPTEAQRTVGYTGTQVGIHGPPRSVADLQKAMEQKGAPPTWDGVLARSIGPMAASRRTQTRRFKRSRSGCARRSRA